MTEHLTIKDRLKIESFNGIGRDVLLGKVVIDQDKCTGCGFCVKACAACALVVADKKCKMVDDLPFCMACGDCTAICPEGALSITDFIEFKLHFKYLDRGKPESPRRF